MIAAPLQISPPPAVSQRPRKRILVGAYAISPARGSEPGVGWQICSRLARFHDVTVLCSPGVPGPDANCSRDEIAQHVARHGAIDGLTLKFVEPPPLSWLFQRETMLCRRTLYYAGAAAWQRAAYSIAADLHVDQPFDLVHHLNITGYREPGYLWKLNAPFVWGPIGGASNYPGKYFDLLSRKERLFYAIRNWTNGWQKSSRRCRAAPSRKGRQRHDRRGDRRRLDEAEPGGGHARRRRGGRGAGGARGAARAYGALLRAAGRARGRSQAVVAEACARNYPRDVTARRGRGRRSCPRARSRAPNRRVDGARPG